MNSINTNIDGILRQVNRIDHPEEVALDFRDISVLRPEGTILCIILSKAIFDRINIPVKWINISRQCYTYLERIDIRNIKFIRISQPLAFFRLPHSAIVSNRLIEIHTLQSYSECGSVADRTKTLLERWFPEATNRVMINAVSTMILEIGNNSIEHSGNDGDGSCFFTLQVYLPDLKPAEIVIAIGDAGIGIRSSLSDAHPRLIDTTDRMAIEQAFINGLSGRKDQSGGIGFAAIKKFMNEFDGEIVIRSGFGCMSYNGCNRIPQYRAHNRSLLGTQTAIILKNP